MATSVTVSAFYTRNLGNFENAKVGYEITSDERREGESIDDFKNRLQEKVDGWVRAKIEEVDQDAGN